MTRTFSFTCGKTGITATASASVVPCERAAEQERGREPVSGDVVAQADHVAGLLAAEHALSRRSASSTYRSPTSVVTTRIPRSSIRRWKPRFVITVTATRSTPRCECEDGDDLVAVDRLPVTVHGEHAIAVAVERDAEVVAAGRGPFLQQRRDRWRRSRR